MNSQDKIVSLEEAIEQTHSFHRCVFTNGCFDVLHRGHIQLLEACHNLCSYDGTPLGGKNGEIARAFSFYSEMPCVIVGVNSDRAVRELKGPTRPINCEQDRAYAVAALECVDYVIIVDDTDMVSTLKALQPDVWVKGGDYTHDTLNPAEREAAYSVGATIDILPLVGGYSTTKTIRELAKA